MATKKKQDKNTGVTKKSVAARDSNVVPPSRLDEDTSLIIRGTVTTADNQPIRAASVIAFDRDLRKLQQFAKAETNERGEFTMSYDAAKFASGDMPSAPTPKLIVRAFVGDQQIGDDVSRPHPTRDEVVNFKALAPPATVVSEWEQLSTGVMPLLEGQGEKEQPLPPWEVNDGDLDFIAEETGLEREKIRLWALAFNVSRDAEAATPPVAVTSAIFYGWFRHGLPLDGNTLLERPMPELSTAIRKSIEANFVPRTLLDQLEALEATLNRLRVARTLEPASAGKSASLGDLLGTLPGKEALPDDQRILFATLHNEHGDTDDLWTQAKLAGLAKAIPALKRTLALDKLTAGHASVVRALQTKSDVEHPESVEFLTTLEPTDWIELVFEHGTPPGSGLDRDGYIEKLQAEVEGTFPTRMLSKLLERRLSESERFPTGKVVEFLKANPDFDVRTQHVEPYLHETDNRNDPLREGLLQLQRVHALTENARETVALLDAGFGSAAQIINTGMPAFALKMTDQLTPERAEEVFAAAEHTVTTVLALAPAYLSSTMPGNTVAVIPAPQASQTTLETYPSLRALFGDLDYCECRHCQSVLGPAAYLADLLHFLQRSTLTASGHLSLSHTNHPLDRYLEYAAGGTVLGVLLQRRPDLADLELSCENTDTKIPYLDLVLEILENAVALPLVVVPSEYARVNIKSEFGRGTVPAAVTQALHKTSIKIGSILTVTPDPYLNSNSPFFNWIITDGSRRWLIQYCEGQLVMIQGAGVFQILGVAGAVDSLTQGTLNAELEDRLRLSQGLPLAGVPEIQEVTMRSGEPGWIVTYTRALAVKITVGNPLGAVELLNRDGTQFNPVRQWQWPSGIIQVIADAFTSDATSKINANVARLLELPASETYVQTWNPAKSWWELSIKNTAIFTRRLQELSVVGLTYQNSSIREHLESSPENRNPAAYKMLSKDAVFPWALPFDLWLEETRAFLEALGVPRATLIDQARPQAPLPDEAGALELLGLSKSEADLIASATASQEPWIYWGLAQTNNTVEDHTAGLPWKGSWLEVLAHLSLLLQQSGLSYREYLDFRQTRFVGQVKGTLSPWTPEGVLTPTDPCKTSSIVLTDLDATHFADHLNRVHLFTRLWRKSGWSMRDLDMALAAFGGHIAPTILQDLAVLKRLCIALGLPVSVVVCSIHKLGTDAWTNHIKEDAPIEPAIYDSVFQRQSLRSLTGFDEFAFEKLSNSTLKISARADFVAASLGIKPDQVKAWINGTTSLGIADSGSWFSVGNLQDLPGLVGKLSSLIPDVLSAYVWGQIPPETQTQVQHTALSMDRRKSVLVDALNTIVQGVNIYVDTGYSGTSAATHTLAAQHPTGPDLVRLNGILLAEAYPLEITRNPDSAKLDSLSRLYAAASLCRVLRIAPETLPDVVTLLGTGVNPFGTLLPAPTTPDEIAQQAQARAHAMLEFVERVGYVRKSGFDFETLSYLLRHNALPGGAGDASTRVEQQLTQTLMELRSSLQTGVVLGDVSADNLTRQLARLGWYPALITQVMGSEGLTYHPGASVEISPPDALASEPLIPLNLRSKFIYQKGSLLLSVGDLKDLAGLVAKFTSAAAPSLLSAYLWNHIPTTAQTRMQDLALGVEEKSSVLVDALNTIVQGVNIYVDTGYSGTSAATHTLAAQHPTGPDLVRLNVILLAEAYPLEIARNQAVLKCTGSLGPSDFAGIANLFPPPKITALEHQYNARLSAQAKILANLMQVFELPTIVEALSNLTTLPVIPDDFKDRLSFEMTSPTEGKLILTGWLSDKEKLAVSQASPNNPVLVAAVSKLYTQVVNYVPGLTAPKFITSTDAEQLLREPDVEARYLTILLRLVPHLELDLVTAQLSSALGLDQQVIGRLLDTVKIHARSAKDLLTDSDFLRSDSKNRPQRTPGFTVDDLRDLAGLVGKFNKAAAPSLSAYIWSRIPTAAQTRVQDLTLGVDQRSSVLVDALNTIVKGASIYDAALFSVVPLSSETQVLVTQNPTGSDLVRLNGILLAEAYPLEIARKWPSQFEVLELLGKVASIGNSLAIQPDQWDWVLSSPFTIMDIRKLPTSTVSESASFDAWRQLVDLFHLRDVLSDGPARLFKIATALKASDFATVRKEFAAAFELSETEVIGACSSDLLAFKSTVPDEDYHNPSRLLQLAQLLHVIKALGTTAPNITQLINSAPGESVAQLARNLFAASIDASALPDRMRPISNRLRHLQRDALVAYLINHDHLETSNELFDRYLIDVEMGACMLTSRMKQAISSVQLFVQRCLLNLERPVHPGEPGVSPISIDSRRWQWMKYYRVWEANRKVFLYPENWIEPELRDDKSEIFQALESDLLQSELTHDTALLAFRKYVDALGDVARLTVIGMFDEKIGDDALVHIVARDNSQPYKHYYRQWRLGPTYVYGNWTSWEEISTQVDSEHVVVFVHAGNVHLAWPTITKKQTEVSWSVRMNLARRTATGWTKLRKGRGELSCSMTPNKDEANSLAFRFSQNPPSIEYFGPMVKWVAPHSPESQFTQFEPTQFILVPGKSESESAGRVENLAARKLDLRVRILRKYTDLNGVVFYDVAKPSDAKVTATILGMWLLSSFKSPLPFIVERELRPPKPPGFGIDYGGVFSIFNDMWDLGPLSSFGLPYSNAAAIYAQQMIGLRASISTPGVIYKKQELRSEFKTLEKDAAWNIDFIFETDESKISDDHPELGANRQLSLSKIGSFLLKDDVSFDLLKAQAGGALESPPLQGTEHYSSGYREIPNAGDHALTVGGAQIFSGTPGLFFTCRTGQQPGQNFLSYHDDAVDLLLWGESTSQQYRLVPMSVTGTMEMRREVAKADLASAVQLPEKLSKPLIAATNVAEGSILESSIRFEDLPSSNYHWEVFFHNPLLIATQLSQAQRFEEAQLWFHLIFDPTTNDAGSEPTRYWRFLPFRKAGQGVAIEELLKDMTQGKISLQDEINEWAKNPFRPHLIARHRRRSYQFAVVQKYLENLIAWGDQLFRRDTIEALNEATQMYVLAAKILGKRPASSPKSKVTHKSYRDLQSKLDDLSNAWEPLEAITATQRSSAFMKRHDRSDQPSIDVLNSLRSLYFCIPSNEKLSGYWDAVEDRLFKIRHCMNIEGIERQLPLFEPPIDPALLVRATAAGLDLAAVFSDLQAPLPLYRFNVMLPKALELCSEVRALGNALVSALEKKDAEQLSLLRSSHEIHMLKLVRVIKGQQQEEAETNLEALRKTREITLQRYLNYQRLLGKQNIVLPAEGSAAVLESSSLMVAPPGAGGGDTQGLALISAEAGQLGWMNDANNFSIVAGIFNAMGGVAHMIPDTTFHVPFTSIKFGGSHIGMALNSTGSVFSILASNASFQANRSSIMGGHQRRYDEWRFQSNTAAKELEQIDKQILANEIRIQMAEGEIANHDQQIANTHEVDEFMRDKFTNQQLYSWMVGQISSVHFRTYQLAHDLAKRAERTYRFELGLKDKDSSFIEFGYWDSLKKGLLSGERLYLDLKRMEAAYLDKNTREYEITKHVSLLQLAPTALLQLKETGECEVNVPEALLDMDFPGHYLRRIKSVSLTIPCVTGPYSTVPCTLTLLNHSVRHNSNASGNYTRDVENDDPRFIDSFGAIQSIVTSSAQNDSGMFETNLRDERYLPFEGAGVISTWRVELPSEYRQFNYDTISDVILHIRYTAREGGGIFKTSAIKNIDGLVKNAEAA